MGNFGVAYLRNGFHITRATPMHSATRCTVTMASARPIRCAETMNFVGTHVWKTAGVVMSAAI